MWVTPAWGGLKKTWQPTRQPAANTAELVDLFNSFKGAIRVFEYIGRLAKPLGYIAGAAASFAALWAAWKSGAHPK